MLEFQLELPGLPDIRTFCKTDFSIRRHNDGGFAHDRTTLLAVSATVASGGDHHGPPIPLDGSKDDRVVRTDLIADQAQFVLGPDQAGLLAQDGRSDFGMGFLLHRKRSYRLGRTNLPADVAVRLAGRHPQLQLRTPEAQETRFPEGGLKGIGDAGFHAFPATDAGAQKRRFRKRPRRPNELPPALKGDKRRPE